MILSNDQTISVLIDNLDAVKIILSDFIEIKPIESLFIISSIDDFIQSDDFISDIFQQSQLH